MKAVNLIPTEQRRLEATGKRPGSSYILIGVLATLLVMLAAYVFTANNVTKRENEATAAKAEADRLEAQAAQRKDFVNFAQVKELRLASVKAVAGTRFDWERLMRELSRVMPRGSWLQITEASVTGKVTGSETSAPAAGATAVVPQPKVNLVGCTPDQSDVARMMVRMRQLHRVSEVELNESVTQLGVSGDAGVDNCGRLYRFDILVSFEPTRPQNEAPRGESVVPASLGGGS